MMTTFLPLSDDQADDNQNIDSTFDINYELLCHRSLITLAGNSVDISENKVDHRTYSFILAGIY